MKNLIYKLKWLGVLNSPFKKPSISFYFGKIDRGVPYFLPRKWKNLTYEQAREEVIKSILKTKEIFKKVDKEYKIPTRKEMQSLIKQKRKSQRAHPTKWQIKIIGLGYKYKFDYPRHEFNPMLSIVGFNRQFCVYVGFSDFIANASYWEAWLFYRDSTKGTTKERVKQCRENYSITWENKEGRTDYYNQILKNKYLL